MTTRFEVMSQALNTSTGNQSFTDSGLGSEAGKFMLCLSSINTALNTTTADLKGSIGLGDLPGDNDEIYFGVEDALDATTGFHGRSGVDGNALRNLSTPASAWTNSEAADLNAMITDGVQLSVDTAGAAIIAALGLWNGDGLTVDQASVSTGTTAADTDLTAVTSWSFEADALLVIAEQAGAADSQGVRYSFGIVTNEAGGIVNRCYSFGFPTQPLGNTVPVGRLLNNRCAVLYTDTGAFSSAVECTAFGSTGFTLTMRDGAGATETVRCWGLKSTDWGFALIDFDMPTSGNLSEQNAGINLSSDGGVIGVCTHMTAFGTATDNTAVGYSTFMYDGATTRCQTGFYEDNQATTDCGIRMADNVDVLDGGGALNIEMDLATGTTGFSGTISNNPASVTKNFALVFGPEATGGVTLTDVISVTDGSPIV
jgi:hypothetical protein